MATPKAPTPIATADALTTSENGLYTFSPSILTANDQGATAKAFYGLGAGRGTSVQTAGHATVTFDGVNIAYNPGTAFDYLAAGVKATDTFQYTIQLANG